MKKSSLEESIKDLLQEKGVRCDIGLAEFNDLAAKLAALIDPLSQKRRFQRDLIVSMDSNWDVGRVSAEYCHRGIMEASALITEDFFNTKTDTDAESKA